MDEQNQELERVDSRVPETPTRSFGPYRVEHRDAAGAAVLHEADLCHAHHASLAPYASQLRLAGRTDGELALIDPSTGVVVARRRIL